MFNLTPEMVDLYISAILIVCVYSFFLWRETPAYHVAEHLAIAVVMANGFVVSVKYLYDNVLVAGIVKGAGTDLIFWTASFVFGALILVRLSPKYFWVSRWPVGIIVGSGIGVGLRGALQGQFIQQIDATIKPLVGGRYTPIDNLLVMILALSGVFYFIFTMQPAARFKRLGIVSTIARYSILIAFGVVLANTTVGRFGQLGNRVYIVLKALGLVP